MHQTLRTERRFAGVDFLNTNGLSKREQRDAWLGVWPLGERTLHEASLKQLPILGTVRGYVSPKLARVVTGSEFDLTTSCRWVRTRKMAPEERELYFPAGAPGAWIAVRLGAISALETL